MQRNDRNQSRGGALTLRRCYEILELPPGAGPSEIKRAFRNLAFVWHPDRFPTDNHPLRTRAEEHFKQLNEAYQTLMAASVRRTATLAPENSETERPAAPNFRPKNEAAFKRRSVVAVCVLVLASTLAALSVAGFRYLRVERAHRQALSRLAVSEGKKETLLAVASERRPEEPSVRSSEKGDAFVPSSNRLTERPALPPAKAVPPGGSPQAADPDEANEIRKERKRLEALIVAAGTLKEEGRYGEAKKRYLAALSRIGSAVHGKGALADLEARVRKALKSEEIRLGAEGYRYHGGSWYSPEAYRTEFVSYRGERVHYTTLRPSAERFADPLVRSHLRAAFSGNLLHKNKVACIGLELLENRPSSSRFQARYRWEVWTFSGVERGEMTLDLDYRSAEDTWEAVWLAKTRDG